MRKLPAVGFVANLLGSIDLEAYRTSEDNVFGVKGVWRSKDLGYFPMPSAELTQPFVSVEELYFFVGGMRVHLRLLHNSVMKLIQKPVAAPKIIQSRKVIWF